MSSKNFSRPQKKCPGWTFLLVFMDEIRKLQTSPEVPSAKPENPSGSWACGGGRVASVVRIAPQFKYCEVSKYTVR